MRILVISAHPDDELLGVGGTIIKHINNKTEVYVIIVSEGASSRYPDGMKEKLQADTIASSEILKTTQTYFLNLPDQRLDGLPLIDVIRPIEEKIKEISPEIVYTHHRGDVNQDHRVVFAATMVAARPIGEKRVKQILAYETPSSTEWAGPYVDSTFIPNVFVDISNTIEQKIKAMQCYESEIKEFPHPRSIEAVTNLAKQWGVKVGCRYAEAFELIRSIE